MGWKSSATWKKSEGVGRGDRNLPVRPRDSGDPVLTYKLDRSNWIPAFAGMSGEWETTP